MLLGPEGTHQVDALFHAGSPFSDGYPNVGVFVDEHLIVASAGADAEDHSSTGNVVYGRQCVGQVHRVPQRVQHDGRADLYPAGARAQGRHDG